MTSPNNLIPITVSSGFDPEGNERIHAAKEQVNIRAAFIPPKQLWLAERFFMGLHKSADNGLSFSSNVNSTEPDAPGFSYAYSAGSRLFHISYDTGHTTTDGVNFTALNAITGIHGSSGVLQTSTEYLIFPFGVSQLFASTDGVNFAARSLGAIYPTKPAKKDSTILAIDGNNNAQIDISTNAGTSFTGYTDSALNLVTWLLATPTKFFAFGRNPSGSALRIRSSLTGLNGSWSDVTPPISTTALAYGAAVSTSGRIVVALNISSTVMETWYTDDEGATWTQGGTITTYATFTSSTVNNVTFCAGAFFITAQTASGGIMTVFRSVDGIAWSPVFTSSISTLVGVCEFTP